MIHENIEEQQTNVKFFPTFTGLESLFCFDFG